MKIIRIDWVIDKLIYYICFICHSLSSCSPLKPINFAMGIISTMTLLWMVFLILILVSPEARSKLIFYFIAEQLPQKLEGADRISYEAER